jgi:5'-nucleotidase
MKPLALLSNDDGYDSPGLLALADAASAVFEVVVVAPLHEQSATSHSLSLHRPLRAREIEGHSYRCVAIDGTPADCVYLALHSGTRFLPRRPDLVLSGINRGLNLGQDAFYSGTVAAAREGALRGIPALALSARSTKNLADTTRVGIALATRLFETCAGRAVLFGLNMPAEWNGQLQVARLGKRLYDEVVETRNDPRGREYFWLGGPDVRHEVDPGSDTEAHDAGFATLSALQLDLTEPRGQALAETLAAPFALPS